jgi:hypothetical protein
MHALDHEQNVRCVSSRACRQKKRSAVWTCISTSWPACLAPHRPNYSRRRALTFFRAGAGAGAGAVPRLLLVPLPLLLPLLLPPPWLRLSPHRKRSTRSDVTVVDQGYTVEISRRNRSDSRCAITEYEIA